MEDTAVPATTSEGIPFNESNKEATEVEDDMDDVVYMGTTVGTGSVPAVGTSAAAAVTTGTADIASISGQQPQVLLRHNLFQLIPQQDASLTTTSTTNDELPHPPTSTLVAVPDSTANSITTTTAATATTTSATEADRMIQRNPTMKGRYQRLKRICHQTRNRPSFTTLLQSNLDIDNDYIHRIDDNNNNDTDDDDDSDDDLSATKTVILEQLPKRIRIDLDVEFGLKPPSQNNDLYNKQHRYFNKNYNKNHSNKENDHYYYHHPTTTTTNIVDERIMTSNNDKTDATTITDSTYNDQNIAEDEEGWYEGIASFYLPYEDHIYVTNPIQLFIRQHVHFFSAITNTTTTTTTSTTAMPTTITSTTPSPSVSTHNAAATIKDKTLPSSTLTSSPFPAAASAPPVTSVSSSTTTATTTTTSSSIERGRVGLRCNHCTIATKAVGYEILLNSGSYYCTGLYDPNQVKEHVQQQKQQQKVHSKKIFPMAAISGSIYYPNNITHFANGSYVNKFQNHFLNHCPHISDENKIALYNLLDDTNNNNNSTNSTTLQIYNIITARRIGLVDAEHESVKTSGIAIDSHPHHQQQQQQRGMRFRRDLNCPNPLPFTNIRYQVEYEYKTLLSSSAIAGSTTATISQHGNNALLSTLATTGIKSNRSNQSSAVTTNNNNNSETAMVEAEAVLKETLAETDDGRLCMKQDRDMLTDFIFLTMRQMALCHSEVDDLTSKWKRSRNLILGYAGFCCRWCMDKNKNTTTKNDISATTTTTQPNDPIKTKTTTSTIQVPPAARFFPSAPDHLTSGIATSFVTHLYKCSLVPKRIKNALMTFKKLHLRQMQQRPHGSQRRLYLSFWSKLRAEDKKVKSLFPSNRNKAQKEGDTNDIATGSTTTRGDDGDDNNDEIMDDASNSKVDEDNAEGRGEEGEDGDE